MENSPRRPGCRRCQSPDHRESLALATRFARNAFLFNGAADCRNMPLERDGLQRPRALAAPQLDRAGQMHAEVDQAVFEKRHPHLDRKRALPRIRPSAEHARHRRLQPRPASPVSMGRGVPVMAAEEFVGAFSGEEHLDAVGPAGASDGQQRGLAVMVRGAVEVPDAHRPEPQVVCAGHGHLADRHADVAADAQRLGRLAVADGGRRPRSRPCPACRRRHRPR